jgi:hypothetical protein
MRPALFFDMIIPLLAGGYLAIGVLLAVAVSQPGDSSLSLLIDGVIGLFWPIAIVLAVASSAWLRLRRDAGPVRAFYRTRRTRRRGITVYQAIRP